MRLQTKIWLGASAVIASIMTIDLIIGYRSIELEIQDRVENEARVMRAMLMATRRIYQQQFIDSGIELDSSTLGFLPAHALSLISADFPNWIGSGLHFNNVSDRPRNPKNQADSDELAAIDWFRKNPEAVERVAEIRDAQGRALFHYTAPVWVEPHCLRCHGEREAAPLTIRQAYDEGYGYRVGDLRGVLSIKMPLEELRTRSQHAWLKTFGVRTAGYILLLILLGMLMQRMVTRRLARLEKTVRQLENGDQTARAVVSGTDEVAALAGSFNDMARSLAEHDAQIFRLNQIYAALSATNHTIVRVDNEAELLVSVCRIAVEYGGLSLAWVATPDETQQHLIPAASYGNCVHYLDGLQITIDPGDAQGIGPTSEAWRTGEAVIVQDFMADRRTLPWRERAANCRWGASAAFPIQRAGQTHLVICLYHTQVQAFDDKIIALLAEMSMDIGYALDRLDLIAAQTRMHAALEVSEAQYREVIETSLDGYLLIDCAGRILEVNDAYLQLSGYSRDELLSMRVPDLDALLSEEQFESLVREAALEGGKLLETKHRTRSGTVKAVEVSSTYSAKQGGRFSVFIRDLSKRYEAEEKIQRLSYFDGLTGLPNRLLIGDRVEQALVQARKDQETLALICLDLDNFNRINDSLGQQCGDRLLIAFGGRFQSVLRSEDTIARLGGDDFVVLLPRATAQEAAYVAQKLTEVVSQPITVEGRELSVTTSLGIAVFPADGDDFESLLRRADAAVHLAKQEGRNTYRFFRPELQEDSARALQLESDLRRALERDELVLHYQPQVQAAGDRVIGVEALIRWRHPRLGLVSPGEFIPIAEESGLIIPIGEWVLRTAVRQLASWMSGGLPIRLVAVNLSAVQFRQQDLPARVETILREADLPPHCLELELTESVTMVDPESAIAVMEALHALGVRISIDDFGTGYSSLSYLRRFPIDKLKIDQSFVRELGMNPESEAIVRSIIGLADSMRFETIAEGVETQQQLSFLRANGCREIQGYLFSRPLPEEDLINWLKSFGQ